jgi:pimeloyl-ACP methyl ester carboxylesterase
VRSSDARPIGDAVRYLVMEDMHDLPIGIAAISYAVGPAIIAALLDDVRGEVDFVVGLGGYYDTLDVITYITTGAYRDSPDEDWSFGDPYPFSKWIFLASNADVLDDATDRADLTEISDRRLADPAAPIDDLTVGLGPEGRSVLAVMTNHDPDRVPALVEALPRPVRAEIAALSLAGRDLTPLAGRLILIHGREDRMVPYTESRDLAAAVGDTELFEVPGFSHIDPKSVGLWGRLILIDAMQEVLSRRRFTGHAQDAGG